jgi:hypothetical protein
MALSNTITITVRTTDSGTVSKQFTVTDEGSENASITVADSATAEIQANFTLAALEMFYLNVTGAAVIETNSATEADDSFTLVANKPMFWYRESGVPHPFTATVTSIFVTNSTEAEITVDMRLLKDITA